MRLDKFLADMNFGSRKEVKQSIKKGYVTVNGTVVKPDKFQVEEQKDLVLFEGERVHYQKDFYYLLNKPGGVVSATVDNHDATVLDLFDDDTFREDLFPVGRLDKDTEGLLLIMNDGQLAHRLLSPKHHVEKEYYAEIAGIMTPEDVVLFKEGLIIDGGEVCLPAELKRMVKAVGKEVTYLTRLRMGGLTLDETLALGEFRPLTQDELKLLRN